MATTIMISTSVKPDLREVLFFILAFVFLFRGVNLQQAGYYDYGLSSLIACCNRKGYIARKVPTSTMKLAGKQSLRRSSYCLILRNVPRHHWYKQNLRNVPRHHWYKQKGLGNASQASEMSSVKNQLAAGISG
jgi:hypothetical protein